MIKKILIDIGHPAHIHYFKNCTKILAEKGIQFLYIVRDREATIDLIENLGFNYISRGNGGKGLVKKLIMIPQIDYKIWKEAKKFKPDLFLSFSSPYAAHIAKLMNKPHIAFDDTEHAKLEHMMYRPFSDTILSPSFYSDKLHKRQLLFNSYMELCYLNPKYFTPDISILKELKIENNERYIVIRFISWDANHDTGVKGFTKEEKIKLVKTLQKFAKVFISSENQLPIELETYKLNTHPSKFHDVLSCASLHIGEGATTASESAVLGVPTIYTNSLKANNCVDEEKYGLLYQLTSYDAVLNKAIEILKSNENSIYKQRQEILLADKIDPTSFMVWFIENYPISKETLQKNPDYQNQFK